MAAQHKIIICTCDFTYLIWCPAFDQAHYQIYLFILSSHDNFNPSTMLLLNYSLLKDTLKKLFKYRYLLLKVIKMSIQY